VQKKGNSSFKKEVRRVQVGSNGEATLFVHEKVNRACQTIQFALFNLMEFVEVTHNLSRPNLGVAHL